MPGKLTIEPMSLRDLPLFNTVRNECRAFLSDKTEYTLEEARAWWDTLESGVEYLTLMLDHLPIGYFRMRYDRRNSYGVGLDIHKDFRGRGLARLAYRTLFAMLTKHGTSKSVWLRVLATNARARHIYEDLGFRYVTETPDDDGELEMTLELT